MAIKIPGLKFLTGKDAKSRMFIIVSAVIVFAFVIYLAVRFLGGGATTGGTQVASAPGGLQSVPGGQMSPEFYRAVQQANVQASQQAQITGGSAVPTLINVPTARQAPSFQQQNCTVLCGDEAVNVADSINELVKANKLSQEDANRLLDLAKNNVSEAEYAAALDELVRQGKISPEEARKLLEAYKKQRQNVLAAESGQLMDSLIKSGKLPIDVANRLLALQKAGVSPEEYAAEVNRLLPPDVAAQLIAQYAQQRAREAQKTGEFKLKQMARAGQITPDVAETLAALQKRNASVDEYAAMLDQLVKSGKMTPATAAQLLAEYKRQRAAAGILCSLPVMINQEQANAVNQLSTLIKGGKLTSDIANVLYGLQQKNTSVQDYKNALDDLAKTGKLPPDDAKAVLEQYRKLAALKMLAQQLSGLQGNNASITDYTDALKKAVQVNTITPETATCLLQGYQALLSPGIAPTVETNVPGTEAFAQLQQRLQQQTPPPVPTEQFEAGPVTVTTAEVATQDEQQEIQQLSSAMATQAQTLISAWGPPTMRHQEGSAEKDKGKVGPGGGPPGPPPAGGPDGAIVGPTLVKAGEILFATLDTTINSDYPDSPVLATIVTGRLKGAKLLGKIALASSPTGVTGNDKVAITFNLMNRDDWAKSRTVNAFAIDPDTARTVMATSVDYHYLLRYGSLFATSFLSGYASAITQSGATTTTGIFGTSTTNPQISPSNRIAVALGKVGDQFTQSISNYINTPPTVHVTAGVGLGILFMSDVTE